MCGRYAAVRAADELAAEFDVDVVSEDAADRAASWNVAPTDGARVVLDHPRLVGSEDARESAADGAGTGVLRELHLARWGLLPAWSSGPGAKGAPMFNARLETVADKPAFAKSLVTRRCLVPADGYYEWRKNPEGSGLPAKTPFYIHPADGSSLAFAGLYAWWRDPTREEDDPARWLLSTTIVTQAARDGLEAIHDREPVALPHSRVDEWLDPAMTDADAALAILAGPPPELVWHEVSARVGSVRNDDAGLIEPV
ncbi:MAG TPA: DUF159 family protein [Micrococcales bacterium]|uniref:SOS response-associated peptidase n=1 Tax=Miniimonas arenae TaxID=676201 RepID=UPI000ED93EB5|nr:SOS response-associated peptidase [Miniimonas arenae]HCX84559.1 DUF159 family protein [Micrococcales bacterium]